MLLLALNGDDDNIPNPQDVLNVVCVVLQKYFCSWFKTWELFSPSVPLPGFIHLAILK